MAENPYTPGGGQSAAQAGAVALSSSGAGAAELASAAIRTSAGAYIDDYGIHIPSYPEVLQALHNDFRAIYGPDLYLEADSQDGELCAALALRIYDCYALAQSVYNAYSPHSAQGVGLSSVVKTNGIRRLAPTRSYVDLRLIGVAGTTIRSGLALDEANQRWLLPSVVIIPLSGEITVLASSEAEGEIRAMPGEIKRIGTPTRGWQSVENPTAARPGAPVETDYQLRRRQAISTALPSLSIFDGTAGAIAQLPGVTRSRGYENDTSLPDANGIPGHSISFVVEGGYIQAIADTLALKKGPGCGTYGDIAVPTVDSKGVPATMRFFRPILLQATARIRIRPLAGYVSATGLAIRNNVAEYLARHKIGDDVLLSKLYTPVNAAEPDSAGRTFDVVELALGVKGQTPVAANLALPFNAALSCELDDVALLEY